MFDTGHLPHNIQNIHDERSQESVLQHPGDLNLDDPSNLPPHEKPPDLPPPIATLPSNQADPGNFFYCKSVSFIAQR